MILAMALPCRLFNSLSYIISTSFPFFILLVLSLASTIVLFSVRKHNVFFFHHRLPLILFYIVYSTKCFFFFYYYYFHLFSSHLFIVSSFFYISIYYFYISVAHKSFPFAHASSRLSEYHSLCFLFLKVKKTEKIYFFFIAHCSFPLLVSLFCGKSFASPNHNSVFRDSFLYFSFSYFFIFFNKNSRATNKTKTKSEFRSNAIHNHLDNAK